MIAVLSQIFPPSEPPLHTPIDDFADLVMLGAGIGVLIFTVSYMLFFNWRKTGAGKAIMYFALSLDALLGLIILGKFLGGDYILRDWLRLIVYSTVFLSAWGLVITLWRNYRKGSQVIDLQRRQTGFVGEKPDGPSDGTELNKTSGKVL